MTTAVTMNDFADRVCVVTGAASGMGAATAREFASRGASVVVVDRNTDLANAVAAEFGGVVANGDIGDSSFCTATIQQAVDRFGKVDVLVNAAGIIVRAAGIDTTDEQWDRMMRVNVSGTFYMCRAAVKAMRTYGVGERRGAIVNFGSIWGDLGSAGVAAYCASKGAVHNLTRALALDHATDGIRVNAVCPGEVNTPMLASERSGPVTPEILAALASTVPMQRLAEPEEIARVVAFLASDAASYMTGSMVSVDAGYGAR
jgi:meso-butanediol dehydrogenase / (S,S)-butanediol dehydrogenase / diacetyl reductase